LVLGCISCAPKAAAPAEKPAAKRTVTVTVGALLDESGPTATSTLPGVYGLRDFNDYVNKKGGLDWSGGKVIVQVEEYDNRYDPSLSLPAYEKWAARGIPLIITHQSTDNLGLKDRAARDQIVILTLSPTSGALMPPGWVFATYPSYADSFTGFLDWVKKTWDWKGKGTPRVATLTWDTAYGKAHMCAVDYAKEIGIDYVGTEYTTTLPTDITPQVTRLKAMKADYVFTQAVTPIAVYLKDFKRLGFNGRLVVGLNTGLSEWIPIAGVDTAAGTLSVKGLTMISAEPEDSRYMKKAREVTEFLGVTRDLRALTFYPNGTSGIMLIQDIIVRALDKVGDPDKVTGKVLYDTLLETKKYDTLGATMPLSYDETQRRGSMGIRMYEAQPDGNVTMIQDWMVVHDALKHYPECAK
jgi:ABC-type branched-subunit amino acid transport system substrate-binding protein